MIRPEKMTVKTQEALVTAQEKAVSTSAGSIEAEHLLCALIEQEGSFVPELLKKIGLLAQSEVVKDEPEAPLKSLEYFVEEMMKSDQIYGVSPIIAPGFSDAIANPVKRGAKVEIILTEQVLGSTLKVHEALLKELIEFQNFNLYTIDEPVRVAFTVTESLLNLGLYRLDGSYDVGRDLVCISESAVDWGLSLFEHFRRRSKLVCKISYILYSGERII